MIDKATLEGFVGRLEALDGEAMTVGLDKRSVYDEAKKAGINTKMLRRFLAERKRAAKDSQTDKDALDTYRGLLGEPGATYRSVAERLGMSKSKLQRLVPKTQNGTATPHDPETGEIKELEQPGWSTDPQIKPALPEVAGDPLDRDCGGSIGARAASEEVPQETSGLLDVSGSPERAAQISETADRKPPGDSSERDGEGSSSGAAVATHSDDLTPPPFLRRRVAA